MRDGVAIMLGLFALAAAIAVHGLAGRYQPEPTPQGEDLSNRYQIEKGDDGSGSVWRIDQKTGRTCLILIVGTEVHTSPDLCVE